MPVVGLHDVKKDDDDDKERNELYTGGTNGRGGGSGMAVLGPDDDGDDDDDDEGGDNSLRAHIINIFNQAHANATTGSAPSEGTPRRVITMYANGFVVDDGPFRSLDAPENATFVRDVGRGIVPRELEEGAREGAFSLELVDKRGTEYTAPAYVAFSGGGQSLGSTESKTPDGAAVRVLGTPSEAAGEVPVVDESQPKTVLQIRLADGKRMRATLNLSHTVRHVEALVRSEGAGAAPYVLLAGYPPLPLSDPNATIEAAGLKGASITQKLA